MDSDKDISKFFIPESISSQWSPGSHDSLNLQQAHFQDLAAWFSQFKNQFSRSSSVVLCFTMVTLVLSQLGSRSPCSPFPDER
jgi:hypothetical protein